MIKQEMKVIFFKHDFENEIEHVIYTLIVDDFHYDSEKIIFKNCLSEIILQEMMDLKLLIHNKKHDYFGILITCNQEGRNQSIKDGLYFTFDFAYKENDLVIYDNKEESEKIYSDKEYSDLDSFFKRKELIYKYLNHECGEKYWFSLNLFEKTCWLHIALFLARLENHESEKVKEITLDGYYIKSELDLYCYIGEEVCGVLGYMGANFSALRDCLDGSMSRPVQPPLKIVWKNFEYSKHNFVGQYCEIQEMVNFISESAVLELY